MRRRDLEGDMTTSRRREPAATSRVPPQLRGIDANLVVALHALLAHRNVTRAGKELRLGQSSMSHALARLRGHFDDPLLVRVGRQLVLTERAKALVGPVDEAISGLTKVFTRPEAFDPKTSRRVFRVAATDNLELYVLPKIASLLQRSAPGIDVRVCALPEDWTAALLRGDIDLKLGRRAPLARGLADQTLSQERFACVARRGHPVSKKPTLAELAAHEHLLVAPTASPGVDASGVVDTLLRKHGLERRVRMTVSHFLVAPFVVASSDLLLTAPARLLEPFVSLLRLRRIELPVKLARYELAQVWAARSSSDEGLAWLRANVARVFEAST